ncbi:MAG: cell division protein FtsZ [Candidatus Paceibacterota bacterium]
MASKKKKTIAKKKAKTSKSKKAKSSVVAKKPVKIKKSAVKKARSTSSGPSAKKATTVKISKKKSGRKSSEADKQLDTAKKIKIRIVGIGGGGGNIVAELSKKLKDFSIQKIDFIAANTDNQALHSLNKNIKKFSFGQKMTRGLGTGRDVELGERAAREDFEKIKSLFAEDRDLYIIISSLGGGTGTGSSPIFTKACSDFGLPVLGIFTMPFVFEGKKKMDDAQKALERMKENLNAFMILPNEKIFGLTKEEISFTDSLNLLNSRLAMSLDGLLRAIYSPGLINIDWADIRTILEGKRKEAYLNVVKGKINQNLDEFIKSIFKNPILDTQFSNAESVLFNIDGSKELSLQTLAQISEKINELSPNAKIIFGLNQNPKMKNEIKVTILATKNNERKDIFKIKRMQPIAVDAKKEKPAIKKPEKKEAGATAKNMGEEKEKIEIEQEEAEQNIRRNALQAKEAERQAIEKEEESEKIFEIPAFLRKNKKK